MKLPSMTLSESQAMDSFDFLGSEDTAVSQRYSMASMSEASEGEWAGLAPSPTYILIE